MGSSCLHQVDYDRSSRVGRMRRDQEREQEGRKGDDQGRWVCLERREVEGVDHEAG